MIRQDDSELLIGLKSGDKESFRVIFERYYPVFLPFARRLLPQQDDIAEDLVQNVFMRLWIIRERVDENRSLRNYLLVSVRNEIYCHFRSAFVARRQGDMQEIGERIQNSSDIESDYSAKELEQAIERIVEGMPSRRREIFEMSRRNHLSNALIAEKLGLSVRTVEKHIELALTEIRRSLIVSLVVLIGIIR